jgi:phytanoyl-CoA hydroxylase
VVGLWLALEDATRENGCLEVAPGAHRGPLRERYAVDPGTGGGVLRVLDGTPWPEGGLSLEVPAGSLVVFHDHLPHRSSANRSGRSRAALTLHAHDAASRWSADCWLQRRELGEFRIGG